MEDTQQNKKQQLTPITDADRKNDKSLLPAIQERLYNEIEDYMSRHVNFNISEMSKELCVTRDTVEAYVDKVIEKWRVRNSKKLVTQYNWFMNALDSMLNEIEKTSYSDLKKIQEFMSIFKDLRSLEALSHGPARNADDRNRMVNVHFNNMNLNPKMMEEIKKTMEKNMNETVDASDVSSDMNSEYLNTSNAEVQEDETNKG